MTTGEALDELLRRGWEGSRSSFNRRIQQWEATGVAPSDLANLRIVADWDRRAVNPSSRKTKWLRFE